MSAMGHAVKAAIAAIALYLIAIWGYQGYWTMTAPVYGLGDFFASQSVFSVGRVFAFGPHGLMRFAAFVATLKLAIAAALAWHLFERVRALFSVRRPDYQSIEAALILAVLLIAATTTAPLIEGNGGLVRAQALDLVLVVLLAVLIYLERFTALGQPAPDGLDMLAGARLARPVAEPAFDAAKIVPLADNIAPWLKRFSVSRPRPGSDRR